MPATRRATTPTDALLVAALNAAQPCADASRMSRKASRTSPTTSGGVALPRRCPAAGHPCNAAKSSAAAPARRLRDAATTDSVLYLVGLKRGLAARGASELRCSQSKRAAAALSALSRLRSCLRATSTRVMARAAQAMVMSKERPSTAHRRTGTPCTGLATAEVQVKPVGQQGAGRVTSVPGSLECRWHSLGVAPGAALRRARA